MADRTHNEVENGRNGRHSNRVNFFYRLNNCLERGRENFENFTETLTQDLRDYCSQNSNRENVYVYFEYTQEGTLWVVNGKWFGDVIHEFAHKYNLPLENITFHGGAATLENNYNKWHSIHRPNEGKINIRSTDFGRWLYAKTNPFYHILKFPKEAHKNLRPKKFNCLNANLGIQHRIVFLHYMWKNGLLTEENIKNNLISFHYFDTLYYPIEKQYPLEQELKDMLPLQFDLVGDWEQVYAKIFEKDSDLTDWNKTGDYTYLYDDCYFTVTTESGECPQLCDQFGHNAELNDHFRPYHHEMFITEKTTRPMLYLHPQILYSTSGTLEYLKECGFKTFSNYWSEDYDNEENGDKKVQMIMDVVKELNNKSLEELHEMYWDMMPILKHNQNVLINSEVDKYSNGIFPLDL